MKVVLSLIVSMYTVAAFAGDNSICNADVGIALLEGTGYAMTNDQNGQEKILDASKIISNKTVGNTQTIVTKVNGFNGKDMTMTVVIEKSNGQITSVKTNTANSYGYKGLEHNFSADKSGDCRIDQQSIRVSKDGHDKGLVIYDRQFCDKLTPFLRQMGTNNVGLCSNVMLVAQGAFEERQKNLKKENKDMTGIHGDIANSQGVLNLAAAIQSCGLPNMYKAMNSNYANTGGYGYGFMSTGAGLGGGYMTTTPPAKSSNGTK